MEIFNIDINCDVGEGIDNEAKLLPLVSSCNIACGGHAGDEITMKQVALLAKRHKVKVGAHPSYPDKENFGRTSIDISPEDLTKSIKEQLSSFISILEKENMELHHIKPHGALYNDIAKDATLAKTFLLAIASFKKRAFLYAPYNSIIEKEAQNQGFQVKHEAFADRNYNADLSLVSRKLPNALITEPSDILLHVLSMVKKKQVRTVTGGLAIINADTFCVHGDTPEALQILTYLSKQLPKYNIKIKRE